MKFLITGHKGFIGSYVFDHFSKKYDCIGIDKKEGNDLIDCELPHFDVVIHLAAVASVQLSKTNPQAYWINNVDVSKRLFDHATKIGARILYASSSSVNTWYLNPYGTTKKAMEYIAPPGSLGMRFHNVYAKNSRPDMMYRKLIDNTAKYITHHTRDYTHVLDVVSAIELLYDNQITGVVDIGNSNPVSIIELAQAAGRNLPFQEVEGEAIHTCANTALLESLGWKPTKHVLTEMKNDIL